MRRSCVALLAGFFGVCACASAGATANPGQDRCASPQVAFRKPTVVADHREVIVHFTCDGARQAGTIYLPPRTGRHPAVIWVHGSGAVSRLRYGPLVAGFVRRGIAFLSYDKRGVGESQGNCCPGDQGDFALLTDDAVGAVRAARSFAGIDPARVGFLGASEAGWIAPQAAVDAGDQVAFIALASPSCATASSTSTSSSRAARTARSRVPPSERSPKRSPPK